MKTSIRNKKGFTIVELVIVIAVIAILAAVLIPTFVSLVNKANVSADMQLVHNLNTALTIDKTENGKHDTMHDAVHALDDYGYDVTKLYKTISEGNMLLWDSVNDVFCLYNGTDNCISYYPDGVENKPADNEMYKYFAVYETVPETQTYSIYYIGTETDATVSVGFDAGHTQINVTYTGSNDVAIRMYGGTLTVSGGNVTVYGFVGAFGEGSGKYTLDDSALVHGDDCHLFGEDGNAPKCLVEGCEGEGSINPDHTCTVGEIKHEVTNGQCYIVVHCAICGEKMYDENPECNCGGEGDHNTGDTECEHDWGTVQAQGPTCSKDGVEYQVCSKCGDIKQVSTTPALGHDYKTVEGKPATCTDAGYTSYKVCQREKCGHDSGKKTIAATGHDYGVTLDHDSTGHWYTCKVCGYGKDDMVSHKYITLCDDGSVKCKCGESTKDFSTFDAPVKAALETIVELNNKLVGKKHSTMHDALTAIAGSENKISTVVEKIKKYYNNSEQSSSSYKIVWDQTIDRFVLVTDNGSSVAVKYTYDGGVSGSDISRYSGAPQFWYVYDNSLLGDLLKSSGMGKQLYSIYYTGDDFTGYLNDGVTAYLNVGFDTGVCKPTKRVVYSYNIMSSSDYDIIIRTNSDSHALSAYTDSDAVSKIQLGSTPTNIKHYGSIHAVEFGTAKSNTYYENGAIKAVILNKQPSSGVTHKFFIDKDGDTFEKLGIDTTNITYSGYISINPQ